MSKVENKFNPAKLVVETFRIIGSNFECDCYIPGEDTDGTFQKSVTMDELFNHITAADKKVWVTNSLDTQELEGMTFTQWLGEHLSDDMHGNQHDSDMIETLAEIINKREKRVLVSGFPDVWERLTSILSPVKKTA